MTEPAQIIVFPTHRRKQVEAYLTKKHLAERWGCSVSWIEQRMRRDGLPYLKDPHSRFVRFEWYAVERWRFARLELGLQVVAPDDAKRGADDRAE
jgi:hypothetical protein